MLHLLLFTITNAVEPSYFTSNNNLSSYLFICTQGVLLCLKIS